MNDADAIAGMIAEVLNTHAVDGLDVLPIMVAVRSDKSSADVRYAREDFEWRVCPRQRTPRDIAPRAEFGAAEKAEPAQAVVTVTLTPSEAEVLDELCERLDLNRGQLLRQALRQYQIDDFVRRGGVLPESPGCGGDDR